MAPVFDCLGVEAPFTRHDKYTGLGVFQGFEPEVVDALSRELRAIRSVKMVALFYTPDMASGFQTPRLLLRGWQPADLGPFAAMNADPLVMRYFPSTLSMQETEAMLDRNRVQFERYGFGFWAAVVRSTNEFAGFIGLGVPSFAAHFTPCVEIGWRLAARFWNQGLATEGAAAVLQHALETLPATDIVSFTAAVNLPSRRVMEKIGMTRNPSDDFDHPRVPKEHPLCGHVLYRARR